MGFVSGAVMGATIGKAVAHLSGTPIGATIGNIATYLSGTPVGVTVGKVVAYLPETSVGATIGRAVAHLPGTWVGATIGATCGTVAGLALCGVCYGASGKRTSSVSSPFVVDQEGLAELRRAVIAGDHETVRALVESASFDPFELRVRNTRYDTPFHHACKAGYIEIARLLYESEHLKQRGAVPNKADVSGACVVAAGEGHEDIVAWLITSCGAEPDRHDDSGQTALMAAGRKGHHGIIRLLIRNGASINEVDRQNSSITAFGYACMNGHMVAAQLLYAEGMERHGRVKRKGSAFEFAVREGREEIARWLIETCGVKLSGRHGRAALRTASMRGYSEIVRLLLSCKDLHVNTKDDAGRTPFLHACGSGYMGIARSLYERDKRVVAAVDKVGCTALMCAAGYGHMEIVQWLIETCGVDILRKNHHGRSAFWHACTGGHVDIVRHLLPSVENLIFEIGRADEKSCTLFGSVAFAGCVEVVRLFLHVDSTLGGLLKQSGRVGWPPLVLASMKGHTETVKLLLDAGAPVNGVVGRWQGATALAYAAEEGCREVVRLLIQRGADVDPHCPGANPPVVRAAGGGYTEIVRLLHDHGADIRRTGCEGCTALGLAEAGGYAETAQLIKELLAGNPADGTGAERLSKAGLSGDTELAGRLSDNGVDVNVADPVTGKTTLMLAAEHGRTEFVRWLLSDVPDVDVTRSDREGRTVLMFAVRGGHKAIVELLVRHAGADALLLRRSYEGWTALMYAIEGGDGEIVELLLSEIRTMQAVSRDSDQAGIPGVTSLMMEIGSKCERMSSDEMNKTLMRAVEEGCADSVRLLIKQGAKVDHGDEGDNTPVILAASRGYEAIVRLLLDAGADPTLYNASRQTASGAAREHGYDSIAKLIDEPDTGK
ncbi:MAG: ankyrin repeat domain-containing protein [Simkaniaceae bacterium]|nr:ankyrin repeat domain-containing protein [Simkaniaceae bacterium]